MKVDVGKLREIYAAAVRDAPWAEEALSRFDDVVDGIREVENEAISRLVRELTTDQRFVHTCGGILSPSGEGAPKGGGIRGDFSHHPIFSPGSYKLVLLSGKNEIAEREERGEKISSEERIRKTLLSTEYLFRDLYGDRLHGAKAHKPENQFAMMVVGGVFGKSGEKQSYVFRACWRDPTSQRPRPTSHGRYSLLIPFDDEGRGMVREVAENLGVLPELVRSLWPGVYNRSEGQLRISEQDGDVRLEDVPAA